MSDKANSGNFFEDFSLGQQIIHATPRTLSEGDASLYIALYGSRFAVNSSDMFAIALGFEAAPIDDMLAFQIVFGRTVPDIFLNADANLGYGAGRFGVPVYPGDTLRATSSVIGLKENPNGKAGVVYFHCFGLNQRDEVVLDYFRWVMVRKRDAASPACQPVAPDLPDLPDFIDAAELIIPEGLNMTGFDATLSGSAMFWDDYEIGEKIDHVDGMTIEESDHTLATRLYQNTAKVHLNQHTEKSGHFGRRTVFGGHIISLARALSFNGLANAFSIAAINVGAHVAPTFAGDTIYAWSEVLGKPEIYGRDDLGALRLRTVACRDQPCATFPGKGEDGKYADSVVLDFDYTVLMPKLQN